MRQYLIEGITGAVPFIVDRNKAQLIETKADGITYHRIPGRFSICDCVNGNNRRYSKRVWEKNLQPGSPLQEAIAKNAAFGLLEHPADGVVTLLSPISHIVTRAELVETKNANGQSVWEVIGEIAVLDTPDGRKLKALIEAGYNPLVSSRGYGSLVKAPDGVDEVQDDYVCEGWDVVIKPSFEQAELNPRRPVMIGTTEEKPVQTEAKSCPPEKQEKAETLHCPKCGATCSSTKCKHGDVCPSCKEGRLCCESEQKMLKENSPSAGEITQPQQTTSNKPQNNKPMELNEIKTKINALQKVDLGNPAKVAESLSQITELHQSIAEWAASDPKRSWEAQKLHKTLENIELSWTQAFKQPLKETQRLMEQKTKLLRVIEAVASTAVTYKKKLAEALQVNKRNTRVIEELTRRGRGWRQVAEQRQKRLAKLDKDFDTACEALDIMAKRYHEDTTELGRRLIVLEFKEQAQDPSVQRALKEASRLRHIVRIREKLEARKPKDGDDADTSEMNDEKQSNAEDPNKNKVAKSPGKVKYEGIRTRISQPVVENQVLKNNSAGISVQSVTESVKLAQRLSGAAPAAK